MLKFFFFFKAPLAYFCYSSFCCFACCSSNAFISAIFFFISLYSWLCRGQRKHVDLVSVVEKTTTTTTTSKTTTKTNPKSIGHHHIIFRLDGCHIFAQQKTIGRKKKEKNRARAFTRIPSRSNCCTNLHPAITCSCTSVRSSFGSSTRCTSCVAARPVRSGSIVCTSPRRLFSICTTVSTFSSFRTSGIFCRPIRALRTGNTSRTATRSRWFWICATRRKISTRTENRPSEEEEEYCVGRKTKEDVRWW